MEETIFVQIAAYRDPQLVPTVKDCIKNAAKPGRLHFCIGWQHAPDENIDEIVSLPQVSIIDMPYQESKGACWIRRKIQDQYNGETYTLQLDSHHRFAKNWDIELIKMYKRLKKGGVTKPLITAYLPSYNAADESRINEVWQINYERFMPEGPIFFRPSRIKEQEKLTGPVPARGVSGHFIFTKGTWCREVKYDPEIYFHGEEISLAVRSYTHGYDLFHPHKPYVWHQYTREGQKKHWDDHTNWGEVNKKSYLRVKKLLSVDGEPYLSQEFIETGLGNKRTVQDFERFAGVEFKTRKLHRDVLKEILPPVRYSTEKTFQDELTCRFKYCIDIYRPDLPESDYDFWCVVFKSEDNKNLYRKDADENEIRQIMNAKPSDKFVHIWREFDTEVLPYKWTVWPHSKSKQWNTKIIENKLIT